MKNKKNTITNEIYEEYRKKLGTEITPVYALMSKYSHLSGKESFEKQLEEGKEIFPVHRLRLWNYSFKEDVNGSNYLKNIDESTIKDPLYKGKKFERSLYKDMKSFLFEDDFPVLIGQLGVSQFSFTKEKMQEILCDAISIQAEEYEGKENNYFGNYSVIIKEAMFFIDYITVNYAERGIAERNFPYTIKDVLETIKGYASIIYDDRRSYSEYDIKYSNMSIPNISKQEPLHDLYELSNVEFVLLPTFTGLSSDFIKNTNRKYKKVNKQTKIFIPSININRYSVRFKDLGIASFIIYNGGGINLRENIANFFLGIVKKNVCLISKFISVNITKKIVINNIDKTCSLLAKRNRYEKANIEIQKIYKDATTELFRNNKTKVKAKAKTEKDIAEIPKKESLMGSSAGYFNI